MKFHGLVNSWSPDHETDFADTDLVVEADKDFLLDSNVVDDEELTAVTFLSLPERYIMTLV